MRVSINYSHPAASLHDDGQIQVDVFKIPAWEELVEQTRDYSRYIHFPLSIFRDQVINTEKKQVADLAWIAEMRHKTDTPFVNLHFSVPAHAYPDIPRDSATPAHWEQIFNDAQKAIRTVQNVFGTENIIVENVPDAGDQNLLLSIQPENIRQLIEAADCGFLLDISHARIAADYIDRDARDYITALPVDRIREIHVTGIELITEAHLARLEALGITDKSFYHQLVGRLVDHLPFTEADWAFLAWSFDQIHAGAWQAPEIVAFEFGGVGGMWEKLADRAIIAEQVPRLYQLVKGASPVR